jgi:cyclopropane-fatty-acyl-phospholipid synthase
MNHGITSTDADSGDTIPGGGDFIDKYVFSEGELPHLSLVLDKMQRSGLEIFDVENLRRHYANTLGICAERFEQNSQHIRSLAACRS